MKHNKIYENGIYVPQRMCISCREIKPKEELIKIVKIKDTVTVFKGGKTSGRGAYICKNTGCVETAKKMRMLEKTFKTQIPPEIYEECVDIARK